MIEMGIVVGMGLLISLVKMNWKWRMHLLSNPLTMDILIFISLCLIHWGTYSGVMVATVGAMTCSLVLSGARWLYGHVEDGTYIPGYFDIGSKLV
jgi:membrane-bound ClpP family serine protease